MGGAGTAVTRPKPKATLRPLRPSRTQQQQQSCRADGAPLGLGSAPGGRLGSRPRCRMKVQHLPSAALTLVNSNPTLDRRLNVSNERDATPASRVEILGPVVTLLARPLPGQPTPEATGVEPQRVGERSTEAAAPVLRARWRLEARDSARDSLEPSAGGTSQASMVLTLRRGSEF